MNAPSRTGSGQQDGQALRIHGLCAGYGGHLVLTDIELDLARGEWLALLGPNGAGKTTLLQCIGGLLAPSAGGIWLGGCSLREDSRGAKSTMGFACAPQRLPGLLTGRQCLEIHAAAKGLAAIGADVLELIQAFGFASMLDRLVDSYSSGARQKLAVLLALLGDPQLVVLDEAFNGLDPASALVLKQHLRSRVCSDGCAVLLATHSLDLVERYSDRAALLLEGRIARQWDKQALQALRTCAEGLEAALAAAAGGA